MSCKLQSAGLAVVRSVAGTQENNIKIERATREKFCALSKIHEILYKFFNYFHFVYFCYL